VKVAGTKNIKWSGIHLQNQRKKVEYRPVADKKKQSGSMGSAGEVASTSGSTGSSGQSTSTSGKESFGSLSSGFLNKTSGGNNKKTTGSSSLHSVKDKDVNVKNSFSVLSNTPETLSEGRVGESTASKEKGKKG